MIYEIYTENGTKKKRALTGNGYGLPLGSIIAVYSSLVPDGYLPCNGAVFDTTTFAALYAYLGSNRLPDLRECNLVGAGQSSNDYDASANPNGIHAHDVYTIGQFKDDQMQGHWHKSNGAGNASDVTKYNGIQYSDNNVNKSSDTTIREPITDGTNGTPRIGTTTHGKQVGVNYCIKATPAYVEPDTVSDMVNTLRTQDSYSTSEVNTGKKWIDGKPIYRKVIPFFRNSAVVTGWTNSASNEWSNSAIPNIIDTVVCGMATSERTSGWVDTYVNGNAIGIVVHKSLQKIWVIFETTVYKADVIIEYTKTTD